MKQRITIVVIILMIMSLIYAGYIYYPKNGSYGKAVSVNPTISASYPDSLLPLDPEISPPPAYRTPSTSPTATPTPTRSVCASSNCPKGYTCYDNELCCAPDERMQNTFGLKFCIKASCPKETPQICAQTCCTEEQDCVLQPSKFKRMMTGGPAYGYCFEDDSHECEQGTFACPEDSSSKSVKACCISGEETCEPKEKMGTTVYGCSAIEDSCKGDFCEGKGEFEKGNLCCMHPSECFVNSNGFPTCV